MNPNFSAFITTESDPQVADLRKKIDRFYASATNYLAFQSPSHMPEQWRHVRKGVIERITASGSCRILEFGAGRSGFFESIHDLDEHITYTAQDVTPVNSEWLSQHADSVQIGPVSEIQGVFDVIFSTFVLEHVSDPQQTLTTLFSRLSPRGKLYIFCPRYDFPFYLSHSADHYRSATRLGLCFWLIGKRLKTMTLGRPAFLIHTDPAVLHLDWQIDRDAIHWVSLFDLRVFFRGRGQVETLPIFSGSVKDWIVKNLLQVNLVVTKSLDGEFVREPADV